MIHGRAANRSAVARPGLRPDRLWVGHRPRRSPGSDGYDPGSLQGDPVERRRGDQRATGGRGRQLPDLSDEI